MDIRGWVLKKTNLHHAPTVHIVGAFVRIRPDVRVADLSNVFIINLSPAHAALPSNRHQYGKKMYSGWRVTQRIQLSLSACLNCFSGIKSNGELQTGAWLK